MGMPGRDQVPALRPAKRAQLGPCPVQPRHPEEDAGRTQNGDMVKQHHITMAL